MKPGITLSTASCVSLYYVDLSWTTYSKNPANSEIRAVIRFMNVNKSYSNQHSSATVWCFWAKCNEWGQSEAVGVRKFTDGVNKRARWKSQWPPIRRARQAKIRENRLLTISELSTCFPRISRALLTYETVTQEAPLPRIQRWKSGSTHRRQSSMTRGYTSWCPATTSASIPAVTM